MRDPEKVARLISSQLFTLQFLRSKGCAPDQLHALPVELFQQLLRDGSVYASGKLAEMEARAHLLANLHRITDASPHAERGHL